MFKFNTNKEMFAGFEDLMTRMEVAYSWGGTVFDEQKKTEKQQYAINGFTKFSDFLVEQKFDFEKFQAQADIIIYQKIDDIIPVNWDGWKENLAENVQLNHIANVGKFVDDRINKDVINTVAEGVNCFKKWTEKVLALLDNNNNKEFMASETGKEFEKNLQESLSFIKKFEKFAADLTGYIVGLIELKQRYLCENNLQRLMSYYRMIYENIYFRHGFTGGSLETIKQANAKLNEDFKEVIDNLLKFFFENKDNEVLEKMELIFQHPRLTLFVFENENEGQRKENREKKFTEQELLDMRNQKIKEFSELFDTCYLAKMTFNAYRTYALYEEIFRLERPSDNCSTFTRCLGEGTHKPTQPNTNHPIVSLNAFSENHKLPETETVKTVQPTMQLIQENK